MNVDKINKPANKTTILVAPLDWGLGHATRCIPVIKLLLNQDIKVLVAADGPILQLLEKELPGVVILRLKGYHIRYHSPKGFFLLKMLAQVPSIMQAIRFEHKWLDKMITEHQVDAVISDNRFGLFTNKVPCVFITHQLFIQTGSPILNKLAQKINYYYINKFRECWVPDAEGVNNLAGTLSHPQIFPRIPVKYLGILSRFIKKDVTKKYHLLFMLSGPEPQRSIFEKDLLNQIKDIKTSVVLVRGLPGGEIIINPGNKNILIFNHLPASELNDYVQTSSLVVARCGYSTIMDLAAVKQKAILIPTPGQTEQEYLATYLKEKNIFYTTKQENFSLEQCLNAVKEFEFTPMNMSTSINENIITDFLERIVK